MILAVQSSGHVKTEAMRGHRRPHPARPKPPPPKCAAAARPDWRDLVKWVMFAGAANWTTGYGPNLTGCWFRNGLAIERAAGRHRRRRRRRHRLSLSPSSRKARPSPSSSARARSSPGAGVISVGPVGPFLVVWPNQITIAGAAAAAATATAYVCPVCDFACIPK